MKKAYHKILIPLLALLLLGLYGHKAHAQSANFEANNVNTCVGATVTFTSTSTGTTPNTTYEWNFGPGASPAFSSDPGPIDVVYSTIGQKTVSLTITEGGDSYTATKPNYITVNPGNTITLSSATGSNIQSVCINSPLVPTITYATTGGTNANVTGLPPGVTANFSNNVLTISGSPADEGNYNFTVELTGGCGTATANGSITVNPLPVPSLLSSDPDNEFCAGTSVTFTAVGGTNYNFRVNGVSRQNSSTNTYTTAALLNGQTVDVIVTSASGCQATSAGITNTVHPLPTPVITGSPAICGVPTTNSYSVNNVVGHSYLWTVSGGVIASGQFSNAITVDWNTLGTGTVSVTQTVDLTGCAQSATMNIIKAPATVGGTLSGSKTICEGSTSGVMTLNGYVGTILGWQYSTDLTTWIDTLYTATSFVSEPLTETTYFRVIVQSGACATLASTLATITVSPTPNLVVNNPAGVCAGGTVDLTASQVTAGSSSGITLSYWTDQAATQALPNPDAVAVSGTYYIRAENTATCFVIEPVTVTVTPKPNLLITPNSSTVCYGKPLSLTLTGQEGSVWNWINPDTTNKNPVVLFPSIGQHIYSATATNLAGCTDTTEITIEVIANPNIEITTTGGGNACAGIEKTYTATLNPDFTYQWFVNDVAVPNTDNNVFTDVLEGENPVEIKVLATNKITSCSSADSIIVNPIQPPVLNMEVTKEQLCIGDQTFITLSTSNPPANPPVYFAWGDGLQGNVLTRGFIPDSDTIIWAEAINATGCITRDSVTILVRDTLAFTINSIAETDVICANTDVLFSGPVAATYTYQWYVNNNLIADATEADFTYSFSQNATVRLVVTDTNGGCSGSAFLNVTIKNAPVFDLGANLEVCEGYPVTLEGPAGTGFTYAWFVNGGANPVAVTKDYSFLVVNGNTIIELVVTSPEGCIKSDQITITSKAIPTISLSASDSEICLGEPINLTATTSSANSVLWFDGLNTLGTHVRTIQPNFGDSTYVFWAQAVNNNGCTTRDTIEVVVNNPPVVEIETVGGNTAICINSSVTVQGPQEAGFTYQWLVDDAPAGNNQYQLSFVVTEDVEVKLTVTDTNGCTTTSEPLHIQVIDLPGIIVTPNMPEICLGESVVLTINPANITAFAWQDGLGGNQLSRQFTPDAVGVFEFWASGVHNVSGCISTDTAIVTVHPVPEALINPPAQTTVCEGQTVNFTTNPTAGYLYKWMINGDSLGSGANFSFVALQTSTVVLEVTNTNGCSKTDEIMITVEDAPEVDLGGNQAVCLNYVLDLEGPENENYTYKWYVNNSLVANDSHLYSFVVTQNVTVRLEVTVGNCTTTDEVNVTTLAIPEIAVTSSDAAICFGESVALQLSTQNATSYVWWDGFTGLTTRTLVPNFSDTTMVYWAEAINNIGCRNRDSVFVQVNALPEVVINVAGGSDAICYGSQAVLSSPNIAGYAWEWFVNGVSTGVTASSFTHTIYEDVVIGLEVTDTNGCVNYSEKNLLVIDLPGVLLSPDTLEVCHGGNFTLVIDDQHIQSYSWFDGLAGNLKQRTFEATTLGSFIYWAEGINSFGCISRDTAIINVNPNPEIEIILPVGGAVICQNETMTLSASQTSGLSYAWYLDGVLSDTNAVFSFVALADAEVKLVVTNVNGCVGHAEIDIEVLDAPELDLGGDTSVCEGYVLEFDAPLAVGNSFAWYLDNQLMSTDSSYSFIVSQDVILRLEVISADGCQAIDEISITSLLSPSIELDPNSMAFCLGETATINLTTNGTSFIWWDGLGTNVHTRSFTPSVGDSTYVYWAEAVNAIGCTSRDTTYVTVNNHPEIEIDIQGLANTFCFGTEATVQGPFVEGYQYQWYLNGLAAGENTDRFTFTVTGESLVKLEVTDTNGCFGEDSVTVFMHNAPGILLSPDSLDICIGESFTLTINPVNILSFSWWDGLAGGQLNRTFTPSIADSTYIYWAEGINQLGCISRDTAYITVHSLPMASIIAPMGSAICQGETIQFETAVVEDHLYEWLVDGVVQDTGAIFSFVAENTVMVGLQVTSPYGCVEHDMVELIVWETPDLDFGDDIYACLNDSIIIEGPEGEGFLYEWFLNDVAVGNNTYQFAYLVTDTVTVRLEMNTIHGCAISDEISITPLVSPRLELFSDPAEICLGESVTLTANPMDAVAFAWWDGFTGLERAVQPDTAGMYYYLAEVISADNCVVQDSVAVLVHPLPMVDLRIDVGSTPVCEGESITFSVRDLSGIEISHVIWNNAINVPMGTDTVKYYTYNFEETMYFKADMVTVEGCISSDSILINVQPLPEITISNDTTICSGQSITLIASGGTSCIWMDEDGNPLGVGYSLTVAPAVTKTYYATITGSGSLECTNSASVTVSVLPSPQLEVTASAQDVCGGTPIILSASGASSYVWSTGQTGPSITVLPMQTTTYYVIGLNESACTTTDSITVNIVPTPVVTLSGLLPLYCLNDSPTVLTGTPAGGIFSGSGVVAGQFRPQLAGAGTHMVIYTYINQFGCSNADTMQTTVVGISGSISLGDPVEICPHEQVTFDAGPGFQKYFWSTGDTTRTATINGTAYFPGTTRTITVVGTIQECSVMGSVELTIRNDCYISIEELENNEEVVLVPNPSTGLFTIQHKGNPGELNVSVFDGRGVGVYSGLFEACPKDSNTCTIDLSYLPKGIYMVTIRKEDKQFVRRMVII